jgi:hypothetical protein
VHLLLLKSSDALPNIWPFAWTHDFLSHLNLLLEVNIKNNLKEMDKIAAYTHQYLTASMYLYSYD